MDTHKKKPDKTYYGIDVAVVSSCMDYDEKRHTTVFITCTMWVYFVSDGGVA